MTSRSNSRRTKENFYRDLAVIAFPAPQGTVLTGRGTDTVVRGSVKNAELLKLVDGKPETRAVFPETTNGHTVEFVFSSPRTVRSLVCRNASPHKWEEDFPIIMEVSIDGKNFRRVGELTANWDFAEGGQITAACDDATGTAIRLTFHNPWGLSIGEIELSETARVHFGEGQGRLDAQPRPRRGAAASRRFLRPGA